MQHKNVVEVSKFLNLIRVLFPKWSFFDQAGSAYVLEAKVASSRNWTELQSTLNKPVGALFHNPTINLHHACENLVHEFVSELAPALKGESSLSPEDLENMIVFRQISAWVQLKLQESGFNHGRYQFRLRDLNGDAFFVSHERSMDSL